MQLRENDPLYSVVLCFIVCPPAKENLYSSVEEL